MLLGYSITLKTMDEIILDVLANSKPIHIVSGNPEVLFYGLKNKTLFDEFTSENSLIIPDGIGVCFPLKKKGYSINKMAGIEFVMRLFERFSSTEKTFFLLGGSPSVNEKMMDYLASHFPSLKVVGHAHGFYESEREIVQQIKDSKADVLLVAMGAPKQELFIATYRDELPCQLMMGVGGTFDVLTGMINRAPRWMIKMNLEWLYRVFKEPVRIKRLKNTFVFLGIAMKEVWFPSRQTN